MVTHEHLDAYVFCAGDIDAWARSGNRRSMTDADWALIEELRLGLHLVQSRLASSARAEQIERRLHESTESESVRDRLRALAAGVGGSGPQAGASRP